MPEEETSFVFFAHCVHTWGSELSNLRMNLCLRIWVQSSLLIMPLWNRFSWCFRGTGISFECKHVLFTSYLISLMKNISEAYGDCNSSFKSSNYTFVLANNYNFPHTRPFRQYCTSLYIDFIRQLKIDLLCDGSIYIVLSFFYLMANDIHM